MLNVISLGAGVQSTTMALMAAHGEITPMPDAAIFADTGWEPKHVYEHLEWLQSPNVLPFPIHVVRAGNIREDLIARSTRRHGRFITVPFFLRRVVPAGTSVPIYNGESGGLFDEEIEAQGEIVGYRTLDKDEVQNGIGRRQCTSHYKIEPIQKKVRELLGVGPRSPVPAESVSQWVGISLDEIIRATPSKVKYVVKRFPLLELRMRRGQCFDWLEAKDYPVVRPQDATPDRPQWPPKSACEGCPFHDDDMWQEIMSDPERRADVVEVDRAIRRPRDRDGVDVFRSEQFMHRDCLPIDEVDFKKARDKQQFDLFGNECEGMCGL